jgi:hypothetical protein
MYDAQTGRFLSRDPVEGDHREVESYSGYVFAYDNPLVFSDPTGAYTLNDSQIAQQIQGILNNLPQTTLRSALNYIRQWAEGEVSSAVGNVVESALGTLGFFNLGGAAGWEDFVDAGRFFEALAEEGLCAFMPGASSVSADGPDRSTPATWLRFAAAIDDDGMMVTNGIGCGMRLALTGEDRLWAGWSGVSYPDFLVTGYSADTLRTQGLRTFLVGDFKLTMPPSNGDRTRRQFTRMARHASRQSFGFVFVLAFRMRGESWTWPITQLVWDQNALLKVVSLTG